MEGKHLAVLNRIGDAMIPGDEALPRFSSLNCVSQLGRVTATMPASDLKDLTLLLSILAFVPGFLMPLLLRFLELARGLPGPLGAPIRLVRIGLRGLIMTLYYGDPRVLSAVGYQVSVYTGDLKSR